MLIHQSQKQSNSPTENTSLSERDFLTWLNKQYPNNGWEGQFHEHILREVVQFYEDNSLNFHMGGAFPQVYQSRIEVVHFRIYWNYPRRISFAGVREHLWHLSVEVLDEWIKYKLSAKTSSSDF